MESITIEQWFVRYLILLQIFVGEVAKSRTDFKQTEEEWDNDFCDWMEKE